MRHNTIQEALFVRDQLKSSQDTVSSMLNAKIRVPPNKCLQTRGQLRTHRLDMLQEPLFFDGPHHLEAGSRRQRVAPERRGMASWVERLRDLLRAAHRADRDAPSQPLREAHDVRLDPVQLVAKPRPGSTNTSLHFV